MPRPRWSVATKAIVSLCLITLTVYLLARFSLILAPLVLALILAYVLAPLVDRIEKRLRLRRGLAALLAFLLLGAVASLFPALLIPPLVGELTGLNLDLGNVLTVFEGSLEQLAALGGWQLNTADLVGRMADALQGALEPLFGQTITVAFDLVSSVVWIVFILVVAFYVVKDAARLRAWSEGQLPSAYRHDWLRLTGEINAVWSAFFRGQVILALVVSVIITIMGLVVGLPYALAMGVLAGLLEFLPSLGHAIWLFAASVLIFFIGSTWLPLPNWAAMLILIGLHLIFEQVDLNYLIPRFVGRRVRLHPLVVIMGIVAGASLAGVLGILLAAPTIASARVIGRYLFANLFDQDPFAERQDESGERTSAD